MENKPIDSISENIKALVLNPRPKIKPSETDMNEVKGFEFIDMHFRFKLHKPTNEVIVQIVDSQTGEVLKEFPPEKILNMVSEFLKMSGFIIDKKV
ncbi:MAG TPA: flagellar protein FlaG [bacterium]|jgi:flagellar protein FlaG|nr:flagellar protein FlaG [Dictyoglomota bacterium]HHV80858.1 flagellar protein FlaG [bacterium]HOK29488.1 flagellar protein FlaG [bacterium]HOL54741.1 flagellar protein FlaG [bacterium]HOP55314.1 flagellar protein FlaG [bacterium]